MKRHSKIVFCSALLLLAALFPLSAYCQGSQNLSDQIKQIYQTVLGREADAEGLAYWKDKIESGENTLGTMVGNMVTTQEYKARYSELPADQMKKVYEDKIRDLYKVLLAREPDTEGFKYWLETISSGKDTLETLTRGIETSEEYRKLRSAQPEQAMKELEQQITRIYKAMLGREPDAEGFKYWLEKISSGVDTLGTLATGIANSLEYLAKNSTVTPDNQPVDYSARIRDLYRNMLGREPDVEGFKYWVDKILSGENTLATLANSIADSDEYKKLNAAREGDVQKAAYEKQLRDLYQNMLGREPDSGGLAYWLGQLLNGTDNIGTVAASIAVSDEYKSRVAGIEKEKQQAEIEKQIRQLYRSLLGREPDAEGFKYWVEKVSSGENTLGTVAACIADSPEYKTRIGIDAANTDYEKQIRELYKNMLGREPDVEGFKYWINKILSGEDTISTVVRGIFESAEYKERQKSLDNRQKDYENQIAELYRSLLGREPDVEGFKYWVEKLVSGENSFATLVDGILNSEEYKAKTAQAANSGTVTPAVVSPGQDTPVDPSAPAPGDLIDAF